MTQTNTVNPQAGTLKQKNGRNKLLSRFSKTASLLLMSILTVSTMALDQNDDSIGNGSTTKGSEKQALVADSCCTVAAKNAGNFRALVYRVPSVEMIRKADSEVSHNFHVAVKKAERIEFNTDLAGASDAEINASFNKDNNVVLAMPAAELTDAADAEMGYNFAQQAAEQISLPQGDKLDVADAEINKHFADANIYLPAPDVAKADDEISRNFNTEGKNEITTPSVETVAKSDAEMHRNLASEKQFKQVKHSVVSTSNKKRIIK